MSHNWYKTNKLVAPLTLLKETSSYYFNTSDVKCRSEGQTCHMITYKGENGYYKHCTDNQSLHDKEMTPVPLP